MRLLDISTLQLTEFHDPATRPKYITASHRWVAGQETSFKSFRDGSDFHSAGHAKVRAFAEFVKRNVLGARWLWIDTCCINQESSAELSEAVNRMFEWYRGAELCVAFLADVDGRCSGDEDDGGSGDGVERKTFAESEWFSRGWTLQELLAPRTVVFVNSRWEVLGHKGRGSSISFADDGPAMGSLSLEPNLEAEVSAVTGIPAEVLHDYDHALPGIGVDDRLKWMDGRRTTREEDMVYALCGIFGVALGANYGERYGNARRRLLSAIAEQRQLQHRSRESVQTEDEVRSSKVFAKIIAGLRAPDPWSNHASARRLCEAETGGWLLRNRRYEAWRAGDRRDMADRCVWMYGKAGCGKTVLCSTAVEDIREHCRFQGVDVAFAAFYFSFSDERKQTRESLVRSLVAQLAWREPGLSMLRQEYEDPAWGVVSIERLEKILLSSIESYSRVFLLLDALDECPEANDERQLVLTQVEDLTQQTTNLSIFVTSRDLRDVRESMASLGAVHITVGTSSADADIQRFVSNELSRDRRLKRLDAASKRLIEETICRKADGMFRWAYCQLQELKKMKGFRPSHIRTVLQTLPSTLDETYTRVLTGIEEMYRADALTLLSWLAYARSPPTLAELVDAVVIDLSRDAVDIDDRPSLDGALDVLSGLVAAVDPSGDRIGEDVETTDGMNIQHTYPEMKIRLAHFSVKEYLESNRILLTDAKEFYLHSGAGNRLIAQGCLTYLMHYSRHEDRASSHPVRDQFPLVQYAARSWYHHSLVQESGEVDRESMLLSSERSREDWLSIHDPERPSYSKWDEFHLPLRPCSAIDNSLSTALYYASFMGLPAVVKILLEKGADANYQGGLHFNPLHAASSKGHKAVVELLLDAGADVEIRRSDADSLCTAAMNGHAEVVRLLSNSSTNVDPEMLHHNRALYAASRKGHGEVVQLLLESGAQVDAQGPGIKGSSLYIASASGHLDIVRILLDAGAGIDQPLANGKGVDVAYRRVDATTAEVLLHTHATDMSPFRGYYMTALQVALAENHREIVKLLIDRGADLDVSEGLPGNVLQVACGLESRSPGMVDSLLAAGANVNVTGGMYHSALQHAAALGDLELVRTLLEAGADVKSGGGAHGGPLQAACALVDDEEELEEIVQVLIRAGADVNATGGALGHPLYAAALGGKVRVVEMLVEAGACVDMQGPRNFGTALKAAAMGGHPWVVSKLIRSGADVNAPGGSYGNALDAAVATGNQDCVDLLTKAGAQSHQQW